jgi:predicted acylesterase/phospholipase RssA
LSRLFNLDKLVPDKGIINTLDEKVIEKFGQILTMKQLYDITGIEFVAVSLNADVGKNVYFNYKTHPNLSVTHAVAASIGVPGVLPRVEYDDDIHIDGALGDPYPVSYYKGTSHKVLGIYIDSLVPPRIERTNKGFASELIMTIRIYEATISYIQRTKFIESKQNAPSDMKHLILRCSNDIKLNSNLTTDDKALMLVEGWEAALQLINCKT